MAELENAGKIGQHILLPDGTPTGTSSPTGRYKRLQDFSSVDSLGLERLATNPPSFFIWTMAIFTPVPAADVGNSVAVEAPWPFTLLAADLGCESAAGATGTLDVQYDSGSGFTSFLDAAEDVKTGAGTASRVAPEDDSEDVDYGTALRLHGASGAAGVMTGAQGHLYCQRR